MQSTLVIATVCALLCGASASLRDRAVLRSSGSLTSYAQTVLDYGIEAIENGTCLSRTESYMCTAVCKADGAESVTFETTDDTWRYIIVNGIPDHDITDNSRQPQACENYAYMVVPLNPSTSKYSDSRLGPVGLTLTGAFIYNQKSSSSGENDIAVINEGDSFDDCGGHSDASCVYHYHEDPSCYTSTLGEDCPLIGYLRDGFPVYGYCKVDGEYLTPCYEQTSGDGYSCTDFEFNRRVSGCSLDQNNGYTFSDGTYGYVLTTSYPYTPPGYRGSTYDVCFFKA